MNLNFNSAHRLPTSQRAVTHRQLGAHGTPFAGVALVTFVTLVFFPWETQMRALQRYSIDRPSCRALFLWRSRCLSSLLSYKFYASVQGHHHRHRHATFIYVECSNKLGWDGLEWAGMGGCSI